IQITLRFVTGKCNSIIKNLNFDGMKIIYLFFVLQFFFFFPITSYCQLESEWLVNMNTISGTFEPVGPSLDDVSLIYTGLQSKDEANGQYIFIAVGAPDSFVSVDISNGQIIDRTPYPLA